MALGLGAISLPADTPIIGPWRDWIGLTLLVVGLLLCVMSTITYFWGREHKR